MNKKGKLVPFATMVAMSLGTLLPAQETDVGKRPQEVPLSASARAALAEAAKVAKQAGGVAGPERSHRLEVAAGAYDRLVAKFDDEPRAAAAAAWAAAGLWRRHNSPPLAEKDYLHAAACDPVRFGQRGLFGAAEMQRRQQRTEDARKTYQRAIEADPRTTRAQRARIWIARLLLVEERVDAAIEQLQMALESAPSARLRIETADQLARAWITKGDLDAAAFAIEHARKVSVDEAPVDPIGKERLRRAYERMSAHAALRRARDLRDDAAGDAVRLDERRRRDK